ncbi:MAG: hypothetical protein LBD24_05070 [Spirochaetaceae bacterium]|nr:hypothetical protein [Spirochaetaceae bacterium]
MTLLEPSETARLSSTDSLNGHGVALFGNNRRPCLEPSKTAAAAGGH